MVEVFSPPRITAMADKMGLLAGIAVDLRTGWDLNDPRHAQALWKYLIVAKPLLGIGTPECRGFSNMRRLNKHKPGYPAILAESKRHMQLMVEIYRWQVENGRWFLHEHPRHAASWQLDNKLKEWKEYRNEKVVCGAIDAATPWRS